MIEASMLKKNSRQSSITLLLFVLILAASLVVLACKSTQEATNTYSTSQAAANEVVAAQALRTISAQQQFYFATRGNNSYGTFDQLVQAGALDNRFSGPTPIIGGYLFTLRLSPPAGGPPTAYSVNADPQQTAGRSINGARHLYTDSDSNGVIRANATEPATSSDPPLQ
jgi:hypothetical protein